MTEPDWLASSEPGAMLDFLRQAGRPEQRKLLLFGIACCRRVWHLLPGDRHRQVVEVAEAYADGQASHSDLATASAEVVISPHEFTPLVGVLPPTILDNWDAPVTWQQVRAARVAAELVRTAANDTSAARLAPAWKEVEAARAAWAKAVKAGQDEEAAQAGLVRCLFENPFRILPSNDRTWLEWNDGLVHKLARAAYDDRQLPEGLLIPYRLAVLADAAEERGCLDADLLEHLRGSGPHAVGCRAVEALLGRS